VHGKGDSRLLSNTGLTNVNLIKGFKSSVNMASSPAIVSSPAVLPLSATISLPVSVSFTARASLEALLPIAAECHCVQKDFCQ
jgi:hypothetical protein